MNYNTTPEQEDRLRLAAKQAGLECGVITDEREHGTRIVLRITGTDAITKLIGALHTVETS
jgi:hypothetical protein